MGNFKMEDLKFLDINRPINRGQVDRLKEIIKTHGYNKGLPIIIDKKGNILDGQHRYVACKELNVTPVIIEGDSDMMIPIVNSTQLAWSTKDYVKYWAGKGFPDYIILKNICEAKKISPSLAYNIVTNRAMLRASLSRGTQRLMNPIKEGTFKFPESTPKYFEKLERKIDAILHLVTELKLPRTDRLIVAIARLTEDPNFSFAVMSSKIEYQRARIYRCSTIREYINMLCDLYNYKNKGKKVIV